MKNEAVTIDMLFYQYRDSHSKYKMVSQPSYLYNGNPIPRKMIFILAPGQIQGLFSVSCPK